jgi:hypothetical protein
VSEQRLDLLFLLPIFFVTFATVRLETGLVALSYGDLLICVFLAAFAFDRVVRRDAWLPTAAMTVAGFMLVFLAVYLAGYFDLSTRASFVLWMKGIGAWLPHALFVVCGVALLARRGTPLYLRAVRWFLIGIGVNAAYGVAQLATKALLGINLDQYVVGALTFGRGKTTGINFFGTYKGEANIYRINALAGDPNHLGVILCVPLLLLLPVYLARPRQRARLGLLLLFLFVVQALTLSRSAALGDVVGLLVLLPWIRPILPRARVMGAIAGAVAAVSLAAYIFVPFFHTIVHARTQLNGKSTLVHLQFYELVPPALNPNPLFGMGFNTFAVFYEFITGKADFGPHSFWVATLVETGMVGLCVYLVWFAYLLLNAAAVGRSEDDWAARFGSGLVAALAGTAAGNFFYLTMQFAYFFVVALLVVGAAMLFAPAPARERVAARVAPGTLGR